jgi:hypothetical protein
MATDLSFPFWYPLRPFLRWRNSGLKSGIFGTLSCWLLQSPYRRLPRIYGAFHD